MAYNSQGMGSPHETDKLKAIFFFSFIRSNQIRRDRRSTQSTDKTSTEWNPEKTRKESSSQSGIQCDGPEWYLSNHRYNLGF